MQVIPVDTLEPQAIVTLTTNADGFYVATNLSPGTYRIVELQQPLGYLDGLDTAGTVDGAPVWHCGESGRSDRADCSGRRMQGIEYNFGEIRPADLRGNVHLSDADGNCYGSVYRRARRGPRAIARPERSSGRRGSDRCGRGLRVQWPASRYVFHCGGTPAGLIDGSAPGGHVDGRRRAS